jgi:hypothetical protein
MPGPRGPGGGICAPPCCGGGVSWSWRLRCSILLGEFLSKMNYWIGSLVIGVVEANPLRVVVREDGRGRARSLGWDGI